MVSLFVILSLLFGGRLEEPQPETPSMCSCIGGRTLEDQIADADLIFEGIALKKHGYPLEELERLDLAQHRQLGFGALEYVLFYATKVWKGSRMQDLLVSTPRQESMCGYPFEEGERYVVYVYVRESQPTTSICTLTKPASVAQEDRETLNALFNE